MPEATPPEGGRMSFLEHLGELRARLIKSILAVVLGFLLCWYQSRRIYEFLMLPLRPYLGDNRPVFLDLSEPFLLYLKVALLAGIFVASPVVLYQLWAFVSPGLYPRERRWAAPFVVFATLFFVAGGVFGYAVAFPYAARFLLSVAEDFEPALTVRSLFAFESKLILGMGLVFELPVVIFLLARVGIVTPAFLRHHFKTAVLIIFVVAAVITPTPDIVTQCVFALPMILLYLLGWGAAYLVPRRGGPGEP
jgi:sec-independent protein translocase protein TatC